jgi:hypothetical protein
VNANELNALVVQFTELFATKPAQVDLFRSRVHGHPDPASVRRALELHVSEFSTLRMSSLLGLVDRSDNRRFNAARRQRAVERAKDEETRAKHREMDRQFELLEKRLGAEAIIRLAKESIELIPPAARPEVSRLTPRKSRSLKEAILKLARKRGLL